MNKIDLGRAAQTLANLGVLAGILLLAYELNQTRDLTRAQTRANIAGGITEFLVTLGSNPDLASLWRRGVAGEELEPIEEIQFDDLMTGFLRFLEDVHYQYRNGLYDEVEFQTTREQWRRLFSAPGYREFWCVPNRRAVFSPEFSREMDALIMCSDISTK